MLRTKFLLLTLLVVPLPVVAADVPRVAASIRPIQALVAGVMEGITEPELLIEGGASPHDYRLRPSDVRTIDEALVVFWIGESLEFALVKPLANAERTRNVELLQAPDLRLLPLRAGGTWESHEQPSHKEHQEAHRHGQYDPHIWLDPHNAMAMVRYMSTVLGEVDPAHKTIYEKNRTLLIERLGKLDRDLVAQLEPVKDLPYIVFHDAYQYFERRYDLNVLGTIVLSPEQRPGARRVLEIRESIQASEARCVFSEPQFRSALVETLIEDTGARHGVLDPLGTALAAGPDMYFQLLRRLAASLRECLGAQ